MLRTLLHDYEWIHLGLGLSGNFMFFVGSVLFLPAFEPLKVVGVWLFIVGSLFMFIGAAGNFAKQVWVLEHGGKSPEGPLTSAERSAAVSGERR